MLLEQIYCFTMYTKKYEQSTIDKQALKTSVVGGEVIVILRIPRNMNNQQLINKH